MKLRDAGTRWTAQPYGFKDKARKKTERKKKGGASLRDCSVCQRAIIYFSKFLEDCFRRLSIYAWRDIPL
jgi:hypothetical protein